MRASPELITVIIPTLNQACHLRAQLAALEAQSYRGAWELVVVDGGSTDGTRETARSWGRDDVPLRIVHGRRGVSTQRNAGVRAAAGSFLAFCDSDDVADQGWLAAMAEAAPTADLIGGALEFGRLNGPSMRLWSDDELPDELLTYHDFLPVAPGGNCGVWADVARAVGWDPSFRLGSSDIAFCWRAQLASFRIAYAPACVMHVRHRSGSLALARQWYRYGISGGRLYRTFRRLGMPSPNRRESLDEWRWLLAQRSYLRRPGPDQRRWIRVAAFRLGRLAGSAATGVVFP